MSDDMLSMLMEGAHFESTRETCIKPPFAWAGGKGRSLNKILPHLPYRERWGEGFGGSLAMTLARTPSKLEVVNDAYSGVVDFYKCLKNEALMRQMLDWIELTQHSREMFQDCKKEWVNTSDPAERAAKWFYMIQMSFGSLGRNFGRQTQTITGFPKKLKSNLECFWPVHHRLKGVTLENMDYEQLLKDYDHHNMVWYLDPPYMHSDPGIYDQSWNLEKHKRLLQVIFDCKGFVALSGYDNELYNSMPWTERHEWEVYVSISPKAETETNGLKGKRDIMDKRAVECLWIKEAS